MQTGDLAANQLEMLAEGTADEEVALVIHRDGQPLLTEPHYPGLDDDQFANDSFGRDLGRLGRSDRSGIVDPQPWLLALPQHAPHFNDRVVAGQPVERLADQIDGQLLLLRENRSVKVAVVAAQ